MVSFDLTIGQGAKVTCRTICETWKPSIFTVNGLIGTIIEGKVIATKSRTLINRELARVSNIDEVPLGQL